MKNALIIATLLAAGLTVFCAAAFGGSPELARYVDDDTKLFWFVHAADLHIGDSLVGGDQDTEYLDWITGTAFDVIQPAFMMAAGDLTDSTNGGLIPNGPHQSEWNQYRSIIENNGMYEDIYFDLPGNHDQYNDEDLSYYLANSIQGVATGMTQHSWSLEFDYGFYHFLGVATCGNDGWPWPFDNAGLDDGELDYVESELEANQGANLTFVFGHHPASYFLYGKDRFNTLLQAYGSSVYAFGHSHDFDVFWEQDVLRYNIRSLGKSEDHHFAVFAVDNDGLAVNWANVYEWPLVVITAPVDAALGEGNPWAYPVSVDYEANPIRALVFDEAPLNYVRYRINNGAWQAMSQADGPLWEGTFDARPFSPGEVTLEVEASGTSINSHVIKVDLQVTACYDGLDNDGDTLVDWPVDPGCYSPSDTDEYNVNTAPVAEAGEDQTATVGAPANLDGSASYDPDGQALAFSWDFDVTDGIQEDATGEQVQATYYDVGDYVVTLTVDDGLGLSDSDTTTIHVIEDTDDDTDDDDTVDDDTTDDDTTDDDATDDDVDDDSTDDDDVDDDGTDDDGAADDDIANDDATDDDAIDDDASGDDDDSQTGCGC